MTTKPFFTMSLVAAVMLLAFFLPLAVTAEISTAQPSGVAAKAAAGKTEAGLPVTYEGQRMNPGRETPRQMETLLRKQYVEWILSWKLPVGGRMVRETVPEIRLPKLKFNLQRCTEKNARFRHPKPKQQSRVSFIQVDNQCAEEKVNKALEPLESGSVSGAWSGQSATPTPPK